MLDTLDGMGGDPGADEVGGVGVADDGGGVGVAVVDGAARDGVEAGAGVEGAGRAPMAPRYSSESRHHVWATSNFARR